MNRKLQVGDLFFHVHRVNIYGTNRYDNRWFLKSEPPEEIVYLVSIKLYRSFVTVKKFKNLKRSELNLEIQQNSYLALERHFFYESFGGCLLPFLCSSLELFTEKKIQQIEEIPSKKRECKNFMFLE